MGPETLYATDGGVRRLTPDDFRVMFDQTTQTIRVHGLHQDWTLPLAEMPRLTVTAADPPWSDFRALDSAQWIRNWYINSPIIPPERVGGVAAVEPPGFSRLEDFDIPSGADTTLLDCLGVE